MTAKKSLSALVALYKGLYKASTGTVPEKIARTNKLVGRVAWETHVKPALLRAGRYGEQAVEKYLTVNDKP